MRQLATAGGRTRVHLAVIAALLVLGTCVLVAPALFAAIVTAAACIPLLVLLVRRMGPTPSGDIDRRLMQWTLIAFAIRLAVGLAISHSGAAVDYFGGDAHQYHLGAAQLAQHWSGRGSSPSLPAGKEGYFYELGFLYWVFGARLDAGIVVNAFLSAALIPILVDTTRRLFGAEAARYTAPLAALLPGLVVWTSQLLREASVLFLIVAAVNVAVRLAERATTARVVMLSILVALLFTFRANVAYVVLGGLAIGLLLGHRRVLTGVSVGAGFLTVSLLLVGGAGIGYSGYRAAATADLKTVNAARLDASTSGASGFARSTDVSTPSSALAYLPVGLVQFALGPFPWQVNSLRQLPALIDVAVVWALVPSLRRGLMLSRRRHNRRVFILLIPALITASMLSLLIGNFGTVVRERMQVVVLLVPIVSMGLALRAANRRETSQFSGRPPTASLGASVPGETI